MLNLAGSVLCTRASRTQTTKPWVESVSKQIVMMDIFAFMRFMAYSLCILRQNRKYISLQFCVLVACVSYCWKSCIMQVMQLIWVLEELCLHYLLVFGGLIWLWMSNALLLAVKCANALETSTSILQVYCNCCLF